MNSTINLFFSLAATGRTYKSVTMEYFNTNGFPKPIEDFDDSTTICKLKLIGPFHFSDKGSCTSTLSHSLNTIYLPFTKVLCWFISYCLLTFSLHFLDGSTKMRQADQQAAKVALQHLSRILSCPPISDTEKNFKGVLKEHLEQLGLKNPVYDTDNKAEVSEELMSTDISSDLITSTVSICEAAVKDHSESVGISTSAQLPSCQESVHVHVPVQPDPPDSSTPASLRKKPKIDCSGMEHVGRKMMCYCRRHK